MSAQKKSSRPGRKRLDKSDVPPSIFPTDNPRARTAYICTLLGLIPVLGLPMGLAAVVYGRMGYRAAKTREDRNGLGHSLVSMVVGGLEFITNAVGLPMVASGLGWI